MRIGLFGGSFDPVHKGHLSLAKACLEQADLDEVWLVPTSLQPYKPHGPVALDDERLAMLELALSGQNGLRVSTAEIERGGVSYTVDTLRSVKRQPPNAELFLLMGADTLQDLPNWREPQAILDLATPLVVVRPGYHLDTDSLPPLVSKSGYQVVAMDPVAISSSEIRQRVAEGEPIDGLCPPAVANYIAEQGLYRD